MQEVKLQLMVINLWEKVLKTVRITILIVNYLFIIFQIFITFQKVHKLYKTLKINQIKVGLLKC